MVIAINILIGFLNLYFGFMLDNELSCLNFFVSGCSFTAAVCVFIINY